MRSLLFTISLIVIGCGGLFEYAHASETPDATAAQPEKGPHRGRLLKDGDFVLELAIFETGVPPEFRVWVTDDSKPVAPEDVSLTVTLTRLGGVQDKIQFAPQGDFLRGDREIYEPHSFIVTIDAVYNGKQYHWQYDNFEGRTRIEAPVAEALDIVMAVAGPAVLEETVSVYGKIKPHPESIRDISARFEGEIQSINVSLGQSVRKGQPLLTIESDESLKSYTVTAPINGIVQARHANPGEQTDGRVLITLVGSEETLAELQVFPSDLPRVNVGDAVSLTANGLEESMAGRVIQIDNMVRLNQATVVRVAIEYGGQQRLQSGTFVQAHISVDQYEVPLAVRRSGLQAFRDFTVVFAKIGDEYEVRMLELGRTAGEWVEVLGGLNPGTEYVAENSYVIKADIEKSGASHDH